MTDSTPRPSTRRAWLRQAAAGLAAGSLASGGCRLDAPTLLVATSWPEPARRVLEAAVAPDRLAWLTPSRHLDPTRLLDDGLRPDVLLGGPIASYARLAREGKLAGPSPGWAVARLTPLGLAISDRALGSDEPATSSLVPRAWPDLARPRWAGRVALGDPRDDPALLATMAAHLDQGSWASAYADLVRAAAASSPLGLGDDPLAQILRGEADLAPVPDDRASTLEGVSFLPDPSGVVQAEGVAALADARDPEAAGRFVRAATDPEAATPPGQADSSRLDLLADLLGAALVDARAELIASRQAIERRPSEPAAVKAAYWMVQPPPWPPASIGVLRQAHDGPALLALLASQLAPEPEAREWLLKSWSEIESPLDGPRFDELASSVDGSLAREPRFRAWLRGEWLAWSRQRFRRTARKARGEFDQA